MNDKTEFAVGGFLGSGEGGNMVFLSSGEVCEGLVTSITHVKYRKSRDQKMFDRFEREMEKAMSKVQFEDKKLQKKANRFFVSLRNRIDRINPGQSKAVRCSQEEADDTFVMVSAGNVIFPTSNGDMVEVNIGGTSK